MRPASHESKQLVNQAGVTPSSVYSMLALQLREVSVNLVKKLCDGLDMTLGSFSGKKAKRKHRTV